MKLFEHPEFRQLVTATREHFAGQNLSEEFIEKDYYVTEVLRIVTAVLPQQAIFKGGTSLSKGWGIINRFSEDVDLLINLDAFNPPLRPKTGAADKKLKLPRDRVREHPAFTYNPGQQSETGLHRADSFGYVRQVQGTATVSDRVLLEAGVRGGNFPVVIVELSSYVARFLAETANSLGTEDESSFKMQLLHYRRTFVEKLFTIHSRVEQCRSGKPLGSHARHYYDLYCLAQKPDVISMLSSPEYQEIKDDCDRISQAFYGDAYSALSDMSFAHSEALLLSDSQLRQDIQTAYVQQCQVLCLGSFPTWQQVEDCLAELLPRL
jgi:hypothetical protein